MNKQELNICLNNIKFNETLSNFDKYFECWKLLYNMTQLESEIADEIRDEADIYWNSLNNKERELCKKRIEKAVKFS